VVNNGTSRLFRARAEIALLNQKTRESTIKRLEDYIREVEDEVKASIA